MNSKGVKGLKPISRLSRICKIYFVLLLIIFKNRKSIIVKIFSLIFNRSGNSGANVLISC